MTKQNIVPFDFEGKAVRVIDRDGDPWLVLADVCGVLEIGNNRDAAARLDDDEKGVGTIDTPGGTQALTIINESGLYSLVLTSRKEAAKRFKKWVTAEVLPSIRRTGGYGTPTLSDADVLSRAVLIATRQLDDANRQIAVLRPQAEALTRLADAEGSLCVTDAAKNLGLKPRDLFAWLRANHWTYSRPGTADIARQEKINADLLVHKTQGIVRPDGSEKVTTQVRVTPKGLARLATLFAPSLLVEGRAA